MTAWACHAAAINYCLSSMIATVAAVRRARVTLAALGALPLLAAPAAAQSWRYSASRLGTSARVLIIGTRPQDEDNALIAWLSLGHGVETGYLSLTRGESGPNAAGNERQAALAVVRTAELIEERRRDGAHQYFTRAYDIGPSRVDSIVANAWPYDSLRKDVASVIRAFRPQVVISLFSADTAEHDVTHRLAATLARDGIVVAADTSRLSPRAVLGLPAWRVGRLLTETRGPRPGAVVIDVGELDRRAGRTYAEIGAEVRQLQRTQPSTESVSVGHTLRVLLADSSEAEEPIADLFAGIDTSWKRFVDSGAGAGPLLDSVQATAAVVRAAALAAPSDSVARLLARLIGQELRLRRELQCTERVVPICGGPLGDLALSLTRLHRVATDALVAAAGVIIDGTAERAIVAAPDSVPISIEIRNGGTSPLSLHRLAATTETRSVVMLRDTVTIPPDSVRRWTTTMRADVINRNWWQVNGLIEGTALHRFVGPMFYRLVGGEDRISPGAVETSFTIAGEDIPFVGPPLVHRDGGSLRGDLRHPLTGAAPISVLLERLAEYERAALPIDRLFRVYVQSMRAEPESAYVTLQVPAGMTLDSARRLVVLSAFGDHNAFFRLRGTLAPGSDSIFAGAQLMTPLAPAPGQPPTPTPAVSVETFFNGTISRDYPHIPTQQYLRPAKERLQVVDVRAPSRLRVGYVKGTEDLHSQLGQLQINAQSLEPSLVSVVDLAAFSTVLIGAGAFRDPGLAGAVPSLGRFLRQGGTIVVLPGGAELAESGIMPYPVTPDTAQREIDSGWPLQLLDSRSPLLTWPNRITAKDFESWSGERARSVPLAFDPRYSSVLSVREGDRAPNTGLLLVAHVGKGTLVYSSLALDAQIAAVDPGAARILVNLLSVGLAPSR
jgi:LmbE family N-acetylglucosaminyl deacetylase